MIAIELACWLILAAGLIAWVAEKHWIPEVPTPPKYTKAPEFKPFEWGLDDNIYRYSDGQGNLLMGIAIDLGPDADADTTAIYVDKDWDCILAVEGRGCIIE